MQREQKIQQMYLNHYIHIYVHVYSILMLVFKWQGCKILTLASRQNCVEQMKEYASDPVTDIGGADLSQMSRHEIK